MAFWWAFPHCSKCGILYSAIKLNNLIGYSERTVVELSEYVIGIAGEEVDGAHMDPWEETVATVSFPTKAAIVG